MLRFLVIFCAIKCSAAIKGYESSLVFVFDTTGSMHDDLTQLQQGAEMILQTALQENVISNFVFVPFHDPTYGPATVTTDKETFKAALNSVRVYGGGDCPEKSISGIQLALNVSLPRSFVYVFTDATAKDHRLVPEVLDLIQRRESQVVFVLTGHCNDLHRPHYKAYQQIAAASSGQLFNLRKSSVHTVLDFVRSSIKGRTVNLASLVNPAGYEHKHEFPVDRNLGKVTISVSGSKPQITVKDPNGEEVTPPRLETAIDLSEIMVVTVHEPQAGRWSVTVGSETQHSLKVVGLSNLTFHHGFSVKQPRSMDETSHRPLQGSLNYMLISMTESRPVEIQRASLLTLEGKLIFEVPLKHLDNQSKSYLSEPFIPPDDFFYISINGQDEDNRDLRRVAPTAIKAKLPDAPYIVVNNNITVRVHARAVLSCKIESLVEVSAYWSRERELMMKPISNAQSTIIEYVINDVTDNDSGTYKCSASNIAGATHAFTDLIVLVDPPFVNLIPENTTAVIGQMIHIECNVMTQAVLQEFNLIFKGANYANVTEIPIEIGHDSYTFRYSIKLDEDTAGVYSCEARNRGGFTSKSTNITIQTRPNVQIIGPKFIVIRRNSLINITCRVENAGRAYWMAQNKTILALRNMTGNFNSVLILDRVDLKDSGNWTCVGENNGDREQDWISIEVTMKPEVSVNEDQILVIYGDSKEITCSVLAYPKPIINWLNPKGIEVNATMKQIEQFKYESVLKLEDVMEGHEGTYICRAENTKGSSTVETSVHVWKPIKIIKGLEDKSVELYSQTELTCQLDAYPKANTTWYHNGTELLTSRNVQRTNNSLTVLINKMDFGNVGLYQCVSTNKYENITLNGTLTICCVEPPQLGKDIKTITCELGKTIRLTAEILKGNPSPQFSWLYSKSSEFHQLPANVTLSEFGSQIIITDVKSDYAGVYRVIAENIIGKDYHDFRLVVQSKPQILSDNPQDKHLKIEIGSDVTLSCTNSGEPKPLITWSKDGGPLVYTKNTYTSNESLIVKSIRENDSGSYMCSAINVLGSAQRNFNLTVFEKPSILQTTELHIEVIEGQLVELPCSAQGYPIPRKQWLHNGQPVFASITKSIDDDFLLRFVANLTDFGDYTCSAANDFGESDITYEVFVWVPPSVEGLDKESTEVIIGYNVTLECNAIGFPVPDLKWQFNGQDLIENKTNIFNNNVGVLNILDTQFVNEGEYACIAENIAGAANKVFKLIVYEPPKILAENFTGPYIASDMDTELLLPCHTQGRPKPYVAWSKDGLYINPDFRFNINPEGTLVVKFLNEELSGLYTCTAINSVGLTNRTVEVKIYALPMMTQADQTSSKVIILEGEENTITCPLRRTPADSVKWYKDAELIAVGDLTLRNATEASSYACVVANGIGSWQANVDVEVEYTPSFLENVNDTYNIIRGDDLFLDCRVRAKPKSEIKWYFNSKIILDYSEDYYKMMNIQTIRNGLYRCVVRNTHGSIDRSFSVSVLVPPFISIFDLLDVQLKEGSNVTLDCNASGYPTPEIQWYYNNTYWNRVNQSIQTTNATVLSEGNFECKASNKAGVTSLVYRVSVIVPAHITNVIYYNDEGNEVDSLVEVQLNKTVKLSCHATGRPTPSIRWLKNGDILSETLNDAIFSDLTFDRVQVSHSGVYVCTASNEGGLDEVKIKLDVLEPPKISKSPFEIFITNGTSEKLEVVSGQKLMLHCHPYGNPMPTIHWYKNGSELQPDTRMLIQDLGEILSVGRVTVDHNGNYTCVARNSLGNIVYSYIVDVLVPPENSDETIKSIRISNGASMKMSCPVLGSPLPSVIWKKLPNLELITSRPKIVLEDDNATLIINQTSVEDSGTYVCQLTNKVGSTRMVFNVSVEKAPSIIGEDSERTVNVGDSVTFECQSTGDPKPNVTWYKTGLPIKDNPETITALDNRYYTITRVQTRDSGLFMCVTENAAGVASKRFQLNVQVSGKWSNWSKWSLCNATCGLGFQERSRSCRYADGFVVYDTSRPVYQVNDILFDESDCKGNKKDIRECHMPPCEDDVDQTGQWSEWSAWSACSATCGSGTQTQRRTCLYRECYGDNLQIRKCPKLPNCDFSNEVQSSREEVTETNRYAPDAEFDLESESYPEVPEYPPDVEVFYEELDEQPAGRYFDIAVSENLDGSDMGGCSPGFRYNQTTGECDDIDECLYVHNKCHATQSCANAAGGYRCACARGTHALGAGQRCLDINECVLGTHGCEQACVNTAGGYVCACAPPKRLRRDRHTCGTASDYKEKHIPSRKREYLQH